MSWPLLSFCSRSLMVLRRISISLFFCSWRCWSFCRKSSKCFVALRCNQSATALERVMENILIWSSIPKTFYHMERNKGWWSSSYSCGCISMLAHFHACKGKGLPSSCYPFVQQLPLVCFQTRTRTSFCGATTGEGNDKNGHCFHFREEELQLHSE